MNIFEDKTKEMPEYDSSCVRTTMVPDETRQNITGLINNRVFESSDVKNVTRPRFGHGY